MRVGPGSRLPHSLILKLQAETRREGERGRKKEPSPCRERRPLWLMSGEAENAGKGRMGRKAELTHRGSANGTTK